MKNKNLVFKIKGSNEEERTFKGILAHYDNIDRDGDIIVSGAFKDSISNKSVVALLFNHQKSNPIGILTLTDTESAVECEGKLYDCANGDIAYNLLKDGALDELSVGFYINEYDYIPTGLSIKSGQIVEGSVVFMPSNPLAKINEVKSVEDTEGEKEMPKNLEVPNVEKANVVNTPIQVAETLVPETKAATVEDTKALNEVEATVPNASRPSYLNSKESTMDFINTVMSNPTDLKKSWLEHLATKGITNPQVALPTAIATSITDRVKSGKLLPFINTVLGVSSLKVLDEKNNELGSGHNRGGTAKGKKKEQTIEFIDRTITSQYIYKLQAMGKELLRQDKKGILYNFIIKELPNRLVKTIEKAIVIGDGLAANSDYKIKTYKPIIDDTAYYVTKLTEDTDGITLENVFDKVPRELDEGEFVVITSKDYYYDLKGLRNVSGNKVYEHTTVVIDGIKYPALDGNVIVYEDFMKDHATVQAVFMTYGAYTRIKDQEGFEKEESFELDYNQNKMLIETYEGGAMTKANGAVVLLKPVPVA